MDIEEKWQKILVNGPSKAVEVKNVQFELAKLKSIEGLKPFNKQAENGDPVEPTVKDAENLKRSIYGSFFRKAFKNLVILSGAGSSMDVGGQSMAQLWAEARKQIDQLSKGLFEKACDEVKHDKSDENLEMLLSRIDGILEYHKDQELIRGQKLSDVKNHIFGLIREKCSIPHPIAEFPHAELLKKVLQRKQTNSRVKVFTLNYDLLFEMAAQDINAVMIDGFSFTTPRKFSGRYFDYDIVQREGSKLNEEDNFIPRVFHLHKLHGSLNWKREGSDILIEEETTEPLMIYPRDGKYKDSYSQPFFEMMARFQRNLRLEHDTLLICVGYSFNDSHVNAAIQEALNQNPAFRLAVVSPEFDSGTKIASAFKSIIKEAEASERILVVSETFSDFATHFPEIMTYDNTTLTKPLDLSNE